jgi:hypothetical protein
VRLRNRPLLVEGLDADLYVPRPALEERLRAALLNERNVLLVGERRAGKTTLVRKVASDLPDGHEVVTVDGTLADSATALLRLSARALGAPVSDVPEPAPEEAGVIALLDEVDRLPSRQHATVVVEGPLDPDIAYTVFGRLRDQLWRLPLSWLVTAEPDQVGALRTPPADAFWSVVLEVPAMEGEEVDELLRRGLEPAERERVEAAPDHPRHATAGSVVRWAQDVLDGVEPARRERDQQLDRMAAALGRQAAMALSELRALGRPVSAGDRELLERLGWTRPNAARWLARMEREGIVRSFTGIARGQGRPPKLYEPAL